MAGHASKSHELEIMHENKKYQVIYVNGLPQRGSMV